MRMVIVKLTTPGGAERPISTREGIWFPFTDANGETTKYQYDSQGRMTAWYDASGKRQVQNQYDEAAPRDRADGRERRTV